MVDMDLKESLLMVMLIVQALQSLVILILIQSNPVESKLIQLLFFLVLNNYPSDPNLPVCLLFFTSYLSSSSPNSILNSSTNNFVFIYCEIDLMLVFMCFIVLLWLCLPWSLSTREKDYFDNDQMNEQIIEHAWVWSITPCLCLT